MSKRQRMADQARVEAVLGLPEQGGAQLFQLPSGATFATAYQRVVYGDRGPYVEFTREDIVPKLYPKHWAGIPHPDTVELPPVDCGYWYVWLYPEGAPDVRVYWQVREVAYADYRRGLFYVYPWVLVTRGPLVGTGQRSMFG